MKNIITLLLLILITEAFGQESIIKQKIMVLKDDVEVEEVYEGFSDFASEYLKIEDVSKKIFCYVKDINIVCSEVELFVTESRAEYDAGETMDLLDGLKCDVADNKVNTSYMLSNDEGHEPFFVERTLKKCD